MSSVAEIDRQAQDKLARGLHEEALKDFIDLLHTGEHPGWYNYHVGRCYIAMRAYGAALHHLEVASRFLAKPQFAYEIARCHWQLGDVPAFVAHFERHIHDPAFAGQAFGLVGSLRDFRASAYLWTKHRAALLPVMPPTDNWTQFLVRTTAVLERHASLEPRRGGTVSFSSPMPNFLRILDDADLDALLRRDDGVHTYFQYCGYDLSKALRDNRVVSAVPFWVMEEARRGPINFVLDACEEAPRFSVGDVQRLRAVALSSDPRHRIAVLTANTPEHNTSDPKRNLETIEYNIYPLLVSAGLSDREVPSAAVRTDSGDSTFTIFNGMPRPHRQAAMLLFRRAGLLRNIRYSWWNTSNEKNRRGLDAYASHARRRFLSLNLTEEEFHWLAELPEVRIETPASSTHYMCDTLPSDFMRASDYHVVSETEFDETGVLRMTEKCLKPIIAGVPFLVVGVPGLMGYIRDLGFDVLDDVIDQRYDTILDHEQRLVALVDEMVRLRRRRADPQRLKRMVDHNWRVLLDWYGRTRTESVQRLEGWLDAVRRDGNGWIERRFTAQGRTIHMAIADPRDVIQREHLEGKFYEAEELAIIADNMPAGAVFVDVGANVGNHTVYAARILGAAKVVPIECSPEAIALLRRNVVLNALDDVVDRRALGFAIGEEPGSAAMVFPQTNNLGAGRPVRRADGPIAVRSGDTLLQHLDRVDFIKIDIPDGEIAALRSLTRTLARHRPNVFIDVAQANLPALDAFCAEHGYQRIAEYERYRFLINLMLVPTERRSAP